jgi:hypothetical protein
MDTVTSAGDGDEGLAAVLGIGGVGAALFDVGALGDAGEEAVLSPRQMPRET